VTRRKECFHEPSRFFHAPAFVVLAVAAVVSLLVIACVEAMIQRLA